MNAKIRLNKILISVLILFLLISISCMAGKREFSELKSEIKETIKFGTQEALFREIYYNDNGKWLFLNEKVLVRCDIKFKAGFVLDDNFDITKDYSNKVTVTLPKSKVLSADLVDESCHSYSGKTVSTETLNKISTPESMKRMEEDLINMGFLTKSEKKMKTFLTSILNSAGYDDIVFKFIGSSEE